MADEEPKGRKIESLSVRYIRGARRIEIHHMPDVAEIAGENAAGKSSLIDAVEWGIRGKKALPVDPLYHGATAGYSRVRIGELDITRKITEANVAKGGTAKIVAADGSKWGERDVQELWGAWTFDPLAFVSLSPHEQVEQVRALAGKEFCTELAFLDERLAVLTERRTEAGREVRRFGQLKQPEMVDDVVDTSELIRQLREMEEHNRKVEARDRSITEAHRDLEKAKDETARAEAALDKAQRYLEACKEDEASTLRTIKELTDDELPARYNTEPVQTRLAKAGEINRRRQEYEEAERKFKEWQAAARKHSQLEQEVADAQEQRKQHLRTAKLPMEGLSWEGGAIALNGTPFAGLSTTEQLMLSARIAMAMSPDLRVMFVRDGDKLTDRSFNALVELARAEHYQLLVETPGLGHNGGKDALIIVDGELDTSPDDGDKVTDDWGE